MSITGLVALLYPRGYSSPPGRHLAASAQQAAASPNLKAVSASVHLVGQSVTKHGFAFELNQRAGDYCTLSITNITGSNGVSWHDGLTTKGITRNHDTVTLGAWKHTPNENNTVIIIGSVQCGNGPSEGFTLTVVDALHP